MTGLYQRFLLLLAAATDRELATHVQYLKEENRILRSKLPDRITVTPQERQRLVRFGLAVGNAIKDLITIVSPRTVLRWVNGDSPRTAASPRKPGRPRTAEAIRDLVLRLARETGWGYTRILGELKKLGIRSVSRTTVVNILREAGLDPGPKRGEGTWSEFLTRHAQTLWACDFFSTKVWTTAGLVEMYVLVFLHLGGRRLVITGMTLNPDAAWMAQQARNFCL